MKKFSFTRRKLDQLGDKWQILLSLADGATTIPVGTATKVHKTPSQYDWDVKIAVETHDGKTVNVELTDKERAKSINKSYPTLSERLIAAGVTESNIRLPGATVVTAAPEATTAAPAASEEATAEAAPAAESKGKGNKSKSKTAKTETAAPAAEDSE